MGSHICRRRIHAVAISHSRRPVIAAGPRVQSAPAETDCVAALRRCMRIRTLHRTHLGTLQTDMGKKRDRDAEEQGRTAIVQGADQPPLPVQHTQHDLRPRGHQVGQGRERFCPVFRHSAIHLPSLGRRNDRHSGRN